ncbi:MAG: PRTRC system protein C [Chitinophagaceae bacterium]
MLTATILPRVFLFKKEGEDISLPDPFAKWSPEKVLDYYAGTYPELTTAKVAGYEIEEDKFVYRLESTIGTKG